MKHILNDITDGEKNSIREQHVGGMKVSTDKFKQLVESKLGDVKPILSEQQPLRDENGDIVFEFNQHFLFLKDMTKRKVQHYLSMVPETISFITFLDCEGADFSDIDLCKFPRLKAVNVRHTPNNFEETQGDCYYELMPELYGFNKED